MPGSASTARRWWHRSTASRRMKPLHDGVDFAVDPGTEVRSPGSARVVHVGEDTVAGLYIVLDHGHQIQTLSCHLSRALVKEGAQLEPGQLYARTGQSGRVTGP